jgi:hypothetical protein
VILANTKNDLQEAANILSNLFTSFGLKISIEKTKTLILNFKGENYPNSLIEIYGKQIENVSHFVYLGQLIDYRTPGVPDNEIKRRIDMANAKFAELKTLLTNFKIKLSTRMNFFCCYVRTRLTYCCETWSLNSSQLHRIQSALEYMLRRMVRGGLQRKTPKAEIDKLKNTDHEQEIDWSWKLDSDKIKSITKCKTIAEYVQNKNTNWIAHVIRNSGSKQSKNLTFNNDKYTKRGRNTKSLLESVLALHNIEHGRSNELFYKLVLNRKL